MQVQYGQIRQSQVIDGLHAQALEMGMYIVELDIDGKRALLYEGERPMRFYSVIQIKKAFEGYHVAKADLNHQSPYDEMIGNGSVPAESMTIPLNMGVSSV